MELVSEGGKVELVLRCGIVELLLFGGSTPSHLFSPGVNDAIRLDNPKVRLPVFALNNMKEGYEKVI